MDFFTFTKFFDKESSSRSNPMFLHTLLMDKDIGVILRNYTLVYVCTEGKFLCLFRQYFLFPFRIKGSSSNMTNMIECIRRL